MLDRQVRLHECRRRQDSLQRLLRQHGDAQCVCSRCCSTAAEVRRAGALPAGAAAGVVLVLVKEPVVTRSDASIQRRGSRVWVVGDARQGSPRESPATR